MKKLKEMIPGLPNFDPYKSGPEVVPPESRPPSEDKIKKYKKANEMLGKLANSYKPGLKELKKQPDDGYANAGITREDTGVPDTSAVGNNLTVHRAYAADLKYAKPVYDPNTRKWKYVKRHASAPTISYSGQKDTGKDQIYNLPKASAADITPNTTQLQQNSIEYFKENYGDSWKDAMYILCNKG